MHVPSTSSARYFLLFVDDCSRFSWLYFLHAKDQALPTFIKFKSLVENQFHSTLKCLQSDNGGEFKVFSPFLTQHGIINRYSCNHTPEQNGRVEHKIHHIIEKWFGTLSHNFLTNEILALSFPNCNFSY